MRFPLKPLRVPGLRIPLLVWNCVVFALLLLVGMFFVPWWSYLSSGQYLPRVELPLWDGWHRSPPEGPPTRIVVTLSREGGLYLNQDPIDASRLEGVFEERALSYAVERKARGMSAYYRLPAGSFSRVEAYLRVDRNVPWRDVFFVLVDIGNAGLSRVSFAAHHVDDVWRRFETALPVYLGMTPPEHSGILYVRVEIARTGARPRFQFGGVPVGSLDALRDAVLAWSRLAVENDRVRAIEVHPDPHTDFDTVFRTLALLEDAGVEKLDLLGAGPTGITRAVAIWR